MQDIPIDREKSPQNLILVIVLSADNNSCEGLKFYKSSPTRCDERNHLFYLEVGTSGFS